MKLNRQIFVRLMAALGAASRLDWNLGPSDFALAAAMHSCFSARLLRELRGLPEGLLHPDSGRSPKCERFRWQLSPLQHGEFPVVLVVPPVHHACFLQHVLGQDG